MELDTHNEIQIKNIYLIKRPNMDPIFDKTSKCESEDLKMPKRGHKMTQIVFFGWLILT